MGIISSSYPMGGNNIAFLIHKHDDIQSIIPASSLQGETNTRPYSIISTVKDCSVFGDILYKMDTVKDTFFDTVGLPRQYYNAEKCKIFVMH